MKWATYYFIRFTTFHFTRRYSKIRYSKSYVERGLKRLHLVQVKTTWILNKKGLCTRGSYLQGLEGLQLNLAGPYIISGIDCSVWFLEDNDDKVQYWPKYFCLR